MKIEYEIADTNAAESQLNNSELNGTFFHQSKWAEVLKETYGYEPRTISLYAGKDNRVCQLNLCVVHGVFGTRLVSLPFSDYGGPLSRDADPLSVVRTLSHAIDTLASESDARYVLFKSTIPELARPLMAQGFQYIEELGNFIVRLGRPFSQIEQQFENDVRRRTRKGNQDGLQVTAVNDANSIEEFYEVYLRDMRRHGSPPHAKKYFDKVWEKFEHSNELRLIGCEFKSKKIGYALHLLHRGTALFYMGIWPGEARSMGVPPFLIANSIRTFAEEDYQFYDFGRTHNPSGEYSFKASFGGEYRSQFSLIKFYRGENYLEPSNWKYRTLSAFIRHMPLKLLGWIGPRVKEQLE